MRGDRAEQAWRTGQIEHPDLARIGRGLTSDPAAAISSSKNLLESLFRIVLDRSQIDYGAREDIPQLYRKVADLLELKAESVPGSAKGSEASEQVLRTLVTTVQSLAELPTSSALATGSQRAVSPLLGTLGSLSTPP